MQLTGPATEPTGPDGTRHMTRRDPTQDIDPTGSDPQNHSFPPPAGPPSPETFRTFWDPAAAAVDWTRRPPRDPAGPGGTRGPRLVPESGPGYPTRRMRLTFAYTADPRDPDQRPEPKHQCWVARIPERYALQACSLLPKAERGVRSDRCHSRRGNPLQQQPKSLQSNNLRVSNYDRRKVAPGGVVCFPAKETLSWALSDASRCALDTRSAEMTSLR